MASFPHTVGAIGTLENVLDLDFDMLSDIGKFSGGNLRLSVLKAVAAAFAVIIASSSAGAADCHLRLKTSLPLTFAADGRPLVSLDVGGTTIHVLVGIGTKYSKIKEATATALALRVVTAYGTNIDGPLFILTSPTAALGAVKVSDMSFLREPNDQFGPGVDGTVGEDLLSGFDLELDNGGKKLNLFTPDHCPGQVVYWTTDPFARIGLSGRDTVRISLDGHPATANLDLSVASSNIDVRALQSIMAPWSPDLPGLKEVVGPETSAAFRIYRYPFKSLQFGGVEVSNPHIAVTYDHNQYITDSSFAVGMDVLSRLHLFFAFKEGYLYATAVNAH